MRIDVIKTASLLVLTLLLAGCTGSIIIKEDPSRTTIKLDLCDGATFRLVIQQDPDTAKGQTDTKSASVDGKAANKEVRFDDRKLKNFDYGRPVNLQLFLVNAGNGDCPFGPGDVYVAKDVTLSPVPGDSNAHSVPLSAFTKR